VAPSAARRRRERRYGVLYVVRALSLEPARPVGFEGYAMECPAGRREEAHVASREGGASEV
jgi:hypothetical protein